MIGEQRERAPSKVIQQHFILLFLFKVPSDKRSIIFLIVIFEDMRIID